MSTADSPNPFLKDALEPVRAAQKGAADGLDSSTSRLPANRRPRILVADDTNLDRQIIRDHLEPLRYKIIEARDGLEALERVHDASPDLVLLDVEMPGLDGFEVCRRIRAEQSDGFLPVLLVTSRDDMRSKIAGFCEGANDYITKPIHPVELSIRVESMLRIRGLEENVAIAKSKVEVEKRKIERVIEGMRDGVAIIDNENRVTLNPAARMTLAASLDNPNCDYKTLCSVLTFNPRECVADHEDDAPAVREVDIAEDVYGAIISALPSPGAGPAEPGPSGAEAPRGRGETVVVLRNITKEKTLEKMRAEFVSYVSHELRTPLTSMRSAISLILSGKAGPIGENVSKFLGVADRNAVRLAKLIDDLLEMSRREAGKDDPKFAQCRVEEPINASITCASSQAETGGITIQKKIQPDLPSIYADAQAIEQVMTNLIGNALKFTGESGLIRISATRTDSPPRKTPDLGFDVKRYVLVSVEDTGTGIPPSQLEAVFDKFHVVRPEGGPKGTGLGLAIARKIVESHGGSIWAESGQKEGTRISFLLPELTEENFYHFSLRFALERCKRAHEVLSVVLLRFEAGLAARREQGTAALDRTFEEVLSILQQNPQAREELIFPFPARREIHLVLRGASRAEAFGVLRNLEKTLKEILSGGKEARPELRFGVATYPEDGTTVPELVSSLSKGTGRLRVLGSGDLKLDLDPFSEL